MENKNLVLFNIPCCNVSLSNVLSLGIKKSPFHAVHSYHQGHYLTKLHFLHSPVSLNISLYDYPLAKMLDWRTTLMTNCTEYVWIFQLYNRFHMCLITHEKKSHSYSYFCSSLNVVPHFISLIFVKPCDRSNGGNNGTITPFIL